MFSKEVHQNIIHSNNNYSNKLLIHPIKINIKGFFDQEGELFYKKVLRCNF